jgi:hypothetical protein
MSGYENCERARCNRIDSIVTPCVAVQWYTYSAGLYGRRFTYLGKTMQTQPIIAARHKKVHKPNKSTRSLWDAITAVAAEYRVMTVRQLYYQMEMRGYVAKDDKDYDKVQRACLQMRRQGALPYEKIVDSSRERRTIYQHSGLHQALEEAAQSYRRNYWLDQPVHVEVWCEKDALTSIMNPVCQGYGVAFQALRGFDSESFAYESARDIKAIGKPAHIFYFGDHDPSGWWIARNLEPTLREFGANATVTPVGVTPNQVRAWGLPQRRPKKTDTRLAGFVRHFGSELCTEVDAIPPNTLEELIKSSIGSMIEPESWYRAERDERLERETLDSIARAGWKPGVTYAINE